MALDRLAEPVGAIDGRAKSGRALHSTTRHSSSPTSPTSHSPANPAFMDEVPNRRGEVEIVGGVDLAVEQHDGDLGLLAS